MYRITLLILASIIMATSAFTAPSFCHGIECPEFKTILTEGDIQIRQYVESHWVSTEMRKDNASGFMTLFKYISGENETQEKMKMTAPVLKKVLSKTPFSSDDLVSTMSFFLGSKYQNGQAPKPTNSNVFLEKISTKNYAIISFGGYSNKQKEEEHLIILGNFLTKNDSKFNTEYYFTAGYDSPLKFLFRHNEVWVELL